MPILKTVKKRPCGSNRGRLEEFEKEKKTDKSPIKVLGSD